MLPERFRLKINDKTLQSWKTKKEVLTPAFKLVFRFVQDQPNAKFGFIVSSKIGKAVSRNRVKRLFSQAIWDNISKFPRSFQGVFIARNNEKQKSYENISDWINKILPKIG